MRQRLATLLALVLLGAALWWAKGRSDAPAADDDGAQPQAVVWRMLDASRDGDVTTYLACFAGTLRAPLGGTVEELGTDAFADYLRDGVAELKGVAVFDVERTGDNRASLVVEYVYADETERQELELELESGDWKIVEAETARRKKSLIPYGTPIEMVE